MIDQGLGPEESSEERLEVGRVVTTSAVARSLSPFEIFELVGRHVRGDWGTLGEEDMQANRVAIREGERVLSRYRTCVQDVYVITEYDRSVTTVLFVDEY